MTRLFTAIRGTAFWVAFTLGLPVFGALYLIPALVARDGAQRAGRAYFRYSIACARILCGVRSEIRGDIPSGRVIVAAKHQSMLDVYLIYSNLPQGRFVMKKELVSLPIFGWFTLRAGAVPVDRGGGSTALRDMVDGLLDDAVKDPQICIYPQGTRVPPGDQRAYKIGVHALYEASGLPCIPAATNCGVFIGKSVMIPPGLAVVEFLDPIPPGLSREEFMARLEEVIETASDRLVAEAHASARAQLSQ